MASIMEDRNLTFPIELDSNTTNAEIIRLALINCDKKFELRSITDGTVKAGIMNSNVTILQLEDFVDRYTLTEEMTIGRLEEKIRNIEIAGTRKSEKLAINLATSTYIKTSRCRPTVDSRLKFLKVYW
jgi:hypothetical protein